jgi:hypothetical protein
MRWTVWALTLVLGCAGEIADPDEYTDPSLLYECSANVDVPRDILQARCGTCHGVLAPSGSLDLVSPEVGDRLYGVASATCRDQVLIETGNLFWGFFYDKVTSELPMCGARMPLDADPLTPEELDCLHLWLSTQVPEGLR